MLKTFHTNLFCYNPCSTDAEKEGEGPRSCQQTNSGGMRMASQPRRTHNWRDILRWTALNVSPLRAWQPERSVPTFSTSRMRWRSDMRELRQVTTVVWP